MFVVGITTETTQSGEYIEWHSGTGHSRGRNSNGKVGLHGVNSLLNALYRLVWVSVSDHRIQNMDSKSLEAICFFLPFCERSSVVI